MYNKSKSLTEEAIKRLKAIKDFTTLGSGYQIALRDIEIRGVGNLLGTKQHGHMMNVGFDTYCELLDEAIKLVVEYQQASTSFIQRKLRIGFNRASRIMEELEAKGIISERDGSKPRQVLIAKDEIYNEQ